MRRLVAVLLLCCSSCSRSLELPDGAPAGSVSGRVVRGIPGLAVPEPVEGAVVQLLGSGLSATSSPAGTFELRGVESPRASVLARFEVNGTTLQRVVPLERFSVGPGRQTSLGDIVLGPSATLRGSVRLKDVLTPGGHFGTAVFVPRGPYTAFTNDDGSFALVGLPAGPVEVQAFRPGYAAYSAGLVEAQGGQTLSLSSVELDPAPAGAGSLSGRLVFVPPVEGAGDSAVRLLVPGSAAVPLTVNADGTFSANNVSAVLLTFEATRTGYTRTRVPNVLVIANQQAQLGDVILSQGPEVGSETPVTPDGGTVTLPDGGTSIACSPSMPCAAGTYCDDGRCRPLCTSNATCDDFRICNLGNGRCFRPCSQGCGAGQICDNSPDAGVDGGIGACLDYCDGTFRCGAFERCSPQSVCVPECVVNGDCPSPHSTCTSNQQCVFDGTCDTDLDCPVNQACALGQCTGRPSAPVDAGLPYACSVSVCDCRFGEQCVAGLCLPDDVPTHYVTADAGAGATGRTPASPTTLLGALADAGPNSIIAVREGDLFVQSGPINLTNTKPGLTLAGGYRACSSTRWVRGDPSSTTLRGPGSNAIIAITGATNVKVKSLSLELAGGSANGLIEVLGGSGIEVSRIRGTPNPNTATGQVVELNGTAGYLVSDVTLAGTAVSTGTVIIVDAVNSQGTIERTTAVDGLDLTTFTAVRIAGSAAPTVVRGTKTGTRHVRNSDVGIDVQSCSPGTLTLEDNHLGWPFRLTPNAGSAVYGIAIAACTGVEIKKNIIGLGSNSSQLHLVTGIDIRGGCSATLQENEVYLPRTNQNAVLSGVAMAMAGPVTLNGDLVRGGVSPADVVGVKASGSGATLRLDNLDISLGPTTTPIGVDFASVSPMATGAILHGSTVSVSGDGTCNTLPMAVRSNSSALVIDRSKLLADKGGAPRGIDIVNGTVELYSSVVWTGPANGSSSAGCTTQPTAAIHLNPATLYAANNTIEAEGDPMQVATASAVHALNAASQVFLTSNLLGGGRGASHLVFGGTPSLAVPANWRNNYAWYERPGSPIDMTDNALTAITAPPGTVDARGNLFNGLVSCYASPQQSPRTLLTSGPCIDTGFVGTRQNLMTVGNDFFDNPRDAGAGPDIGCCERP